MLSGFLIAEKATPCYVNDMLKLMTLLVFLLSVGLMGLGGWLCYDHSKDWGWFFVAGFILTIISACMADAANKK